MHTLSCRRPRAAKTTIATLITLVIGLGIGSILFGSGGCSKSDKITQPQPASTSSPWLAVHNDPAPLGEWLLTNSLTDSEIAELIEKPVEFHIALVDHVLQLKGVGPSERASMVAEFKADIERHGVSAYPARVAQPKSVSAACDQPVEYRTVVYGATFAYQVRSWNSANGVEYTFYFWPSWTDTPDDMRWASTIGWVTYCIVARSWFSDGGIAGHNLCDRPYQLQLGDGVMKFIGFGFRDSGVRATYASLYMHHM